MRDFIDETTNGTDRVARWRERHPEKNRARRDKDNENRRVKRKINKSNGKHWNEKLVCSRTGCNKSGEVHHAGNKRIVLCRDHHNMTHKRRGDGPGSSGGYNESYIREAGTINENLFNVLRTIFNPKFKKVEGLRKGQEALRAVLASTYDLEEINPRRVKYLQRLIDEADKELDAVINAIQYNKKTKRKRRVYLDDYY